MLTLNPFRYGKPVPPGLFVGRQDAIQLIFSRIATGDSTAIVGQPHMGKSSLLSYVADEQVLARYLADSGGNHVFIQLDCHLLPASFGPLAFWERVLQRIKHAAHEKILSSAVSPDPALAGNPFALEDFFSTLGRSGVHVVLLVDEFDTLLDHPNFRNAEFFGTLRSLSSRTGGLLLLTASRLSLSEMNLRTHDYAPLGSPFFNTFAEVRLRAFRRDDLDDLLDRYLRGTSIEFSLDDRVFIERSSGSHPYLIQAAAWALFSLAQRGVAQPHEAATQIICEQTLAYFEDLWRRLSPRAQQILRLLTAPRPVTLQETVVSFLEDLRLLAEQDLVSGGATTPWCIQPVSFAQWIVERQQGELGPPKEGSRRAGRQRSQRIYISSAPADRSLRAELLAHLAVQCSQGTIEIWHEDLVLAGVQRDVEADRRLREADCVLLLLSAEFINTRRCWEIEMPQALARQATHQIRVIPILVRPIDLSGTPLANLSSLPAGGRAVILARNRDEAWRTIVMAIGDHF